MRPMVPLFSFVLLISQANSIFAYQKINFSNPESFNTDLQEFRNNMQVFINSDGHVITYTEDFANLGTESQKYLENNFFFGNANTLWQLEVLAIRRHTNRSLNLLEIDATFLDQRYPERGMIEIKNETLQVHCGSKSAEYRRVDDESINLVRNQTKFIPLPTEAREKWYAYKFQDRDKYIYVDSTKYNTPDIRLYVGEPGSMILSKIRSVSKINEGTATKFFTQNDEVLFAPGFESENKPMWNGVEITDVTHKVDLKLLGIPLAKDPQLITPCDFVK